MPPAAACCPAPPTAQPPLPLSAAPSLSRRTAIALSRAGTAARQPPPAGNIQAHLVVYDCCSKALLAQATAAEPLPINKELPVLNCSRMLLESGTLILDTRRHTLPGPSEAATPRDPLPRSRSRRSRRGLDLADQPGVGRPQGGQPLNQAASPASQLLVQPQPELAHPAHQTPAPVRSKSGQARTVQPRAGSLPSAALPPGDSLSLSHSGSSSNGLMQPRGSGASGGHGVPVPSALAPPSMLPFRPLDQQRQQRHPPQGRSSPAAGSLLRPPAANGEASVVDIDSAKRNGRMLPTNRSGAHRMQLPQPGTLGAEPQSFTGVQAASRVCSVPRPIHCAHDPYKVCDGCSSSR